MSTAQEAETSLLSFDIIGWLLALIVPVVVYFSLAYYQVDWAQRSFLTILSCVLIFWMFKLVPYLVPTFLLIACCLILNIVPQNIILSGFSSQTFFLVLFFSFLSAFIIKSKILFRPLYWLMSKIPAKFIWLESVLYFFGFLLSPIINIQTNRLDLTVPAYQALITETKLFNEGARRSLLLAVYAGSIYFSELFLTGKSTNIAVFEMLPKQIQTQFSWGYWFVAAIVPILIMHILLGIIYFRFFHKNEPFEINKSDLQEKISHQGRLSLGEWVSIFGIILLIVGIILTSLHMVNLAWFCLAVLFFLFLFPVLNKQDVRSYINWPFLLYLGAIIGIANSIHHLSLDQIIYDLLPKFTTTSVHQFIIGIFFVCMISTWLVGTITSIILLFPILLPLSNVMLLNPWVLAFIILVACEAWIFPYQSIYQLYFEGLIGEEKKSVTRQVVYMNLIFIPCRLIALLLSVYYWRFIGLL